MFTWQFPLWIFKSKCCFLVKHYNGKADNRRSGNRSHHLRGQARICILFINPESGSGEEPVNRHFISLVKLQLNGDLTCQATWCWWCSSWYPLWSGSGRRRGRFWATSGRAKVQSGPTGGGTTRLEKRSVIKGADTRRDLQQDVDTLLTMMVPDSVSGPRAPNSWTMEMLFSLSACVVK